MDIGIIRLSYSMAEILSNDQTVEVHMDIHRTSHCKPRHVKDGVRFREQYTEHMQNELNFNVTIPLFLDMVVSSNRGTPSSHQFLHGFFYCKPTISDTSICERTQLSFFITHAPGVWNWMKWLQRS